MKKPRWAIFISGQGSNMSALLDERWDLDIALVVSSRKSSPGLVRARRCGLQTFVLTNENNWQELLVTLQKNKISHIFLLGFMKVVPVSFLKQWCKPILNVHPSLLPQYPGLKSIERAFADKTDMGVTVHHVVPEVDAGEFVLQKKVFSGRDLHEVTIEFVERSMHFAEYQLVRRAVGICYA